MTIKEAVAKFKERVETHPNYPAMQERIEKLKAEREKQIASFSEFMKQAGEKHD